MVSKEAKIAFVKTMLSHQMVEDGVPQQYVQEFVQTLDGYLKHGVLRVSNHRFSNLINEIKKAIDGDKMEHLIEQDGDGQVNALVIQAVDVAEPIAGRRRGHNRYSNPYYGWYNWWYGVPNYWGGWYWNMRPYYLNTGWTRVGAAKGTTATHDASFMADMPRNVLSMNTVCDDDNICVSTVTFKR